MRERPILFSAPMVRAILAGTKTQTRRVVKPQPPSYEDVRALYGDYHLADLKKDGSWRVMGSVWAVRKLLGTETREGRLGEWRCPYGAPGDRLWVRETVRWSSTIGTRDYAVFGADGKHTTLDTWPWQRKVLPAIHMPRGLSRITLEITGVRVERLQAITEEDAKAEGARRFDDIPGNGARWSMEQPTHTDQCLGSPQMAFANLYNKVHAGENWNLKPDPSPWDANPWVWVVSFRRIEAAERAA